MIQFILGPRQVGKTTGIEQWSETIKNLWDRQNRSGSSKKVKLKCILLGSSSLALQTGLSESLTGRFELHRVFHWDFNESQKGFTFDIEDYLRYGGYPGSYRFRKDWERWQNYIKNSIIDTVIGKDILHLRQVRKPALFRQAFEILCHYPAQEVSYTKLLGQLQEGGNTELVKYYLELYEGAFLFKSLKKYGSSAMNRKTSSPKILPLCPALFSMTQDRNFLKDPELKGRVFELAVGADLARLPGELYYWREGPYEVDFVYEYKSRLWAIEVKSGRKRHSKGLIEIQKKFSKIKSVIVTWENYTQFSRNPQEFLNLLWEN